MQRESPTDATVTVHPSIITNVAVVPEVFPGEDTTRKEGVSLFKHHKFYVHIYDNKKSVKFRMCAFALEFLVSFNKASN